MEKMQHYFSPSARGWFNEAIHGARLIAEEQSEKQVKAGRKPRYRTNPDCRIPADAIAVDQDEWQELLDLQGKGAVIDVVGGRVLATMPAATAEEQLATIRARRDRLLAATDAMVAVPDYPITDEQRAELLAWRQALRDFPDAIASSLPSSDITWPPRPSWIGEYGEKL